MISEVVAEFGQVHAFARARWVRYAEQIHPDLRGVGVIVLQTVARKGPVTATELASMLSMDKALISRQVSRLRDLGFIESRHDEADRRSVFLTTTETGKTTLRGLHQQLSDAYAQRLKGWDESDIETLLALLHRFNAADECREKSEA